MKRGPVKQNKSNSKTILIVIFSLIFVVAVIAGIVLYIQGNNLSSNSGNTGTPDSLSVQCQRMCDTNQRAGFCDIERTTPDGTLATCDTLANSNQYNVESCSSIDCDAQIDQTCVSGLGSEWRNPVSGECPDKGIERASSDSPPESGQICCFYP